MSGSFIGENIVLFSLVLVLTVLISTLIDKFKITWLPASAAYMIVGFVLGAAVHLISQAETDLLMFRADLFFYAVLPPIIFEAGYNMKRTNFFKNLASILMYAVFGTVISTFVVGFGLYGLANIGAVNIDKKDALDPLTFGALISSIDPIATLAILGNKQLKCDQVLYSLVFGESVLNDAVAITLYHTFRSFRNNTRFTGLDYVGAMGKFFLISTMSVVIGAVFALLLSFLLRKVNFTKNPSNEFVLIIFFAYTCYAVAELTHMSGIMALFVCGVMMAHYAWYNVSSITRTTSRHAIHSLSHMAESFLFVYMGISVFFSVVPKYEFEWSFSLIAWSVVLCVVGRALNIFPLTALANLGRRKKITLPMQIVMWFSGLRGAISFALVVGMDSPVPGSARYVTTTMVIVVLTTLGLGGSATWVLTKLGLVGVEDDSAGADDDDNADAVTVGGLGGGRHDDPLGRRASLMGTAGSANVVVPGAAGRDSDGSSAHGHGHGGDGSSIDGLGSSVAAGARRRSTSGAGLSAADHTQSSQQQGNDDGQAPGEGRKRCFKGVSLHRTWRRFDIHYMQPWFGGRHAPRIEDHSAAHGEEDNTQSMNPYLPSALQVDAKTADADDARAMASPQDGDGGEAPLNGDEESAYGTGAGAGTDGDGDSGLSHVSVGSGVQQRSAMLRGGASQGGAIGGEIEVGGYRPFN